MSQNRRKQRGVIQTATTAIIAAFGALLSVTGCSAGDEVADGAETLGVSHQALTCGTTTCPADTDCLAYTCNVFTCQAKPFADGTTCGTKINPGRCLMGVCCAGCVAPVKGGGFACLKGAAVTACGNAGLDCVNCATGNSCNTDTCTAAGKCASTYNGDKTPCTNGSCWQGSCCTGCLDANDACQPGTDRGACGSSAAGLVGCASCVDTDPCTTDACTNQACANTQAPDNTPCLDADKCNGDEACKSGKCVGPANFSCDDNNICTADSCDSVAGCGHQKLTGTSCADANKCNGDEACNNGTCTAGTPLNCNDNNPCTTDSCNGGTGCVNAKQNGTSCADGDVCNGAEMCVTGACTVGTPLNCDDNNPCTADSCDPVQGCLHAAVSPGTNCDDGNVCNGVSTCVGKVCTAGTALNCDDNNVCTTDSCVPATGCKFINNTADCSDNNLCTTGDKCDGAGNCKGGPAVSCDDNEDCTTDSCDVAKGCQHVALNAGQCDDGNQCTTGDVCVSGKCKAAGGNPCSDTNPCTVDNCDPNNANGCIHPNEKDGTGCPPPDKCHQNSVCQAGTCSQGEPVDCDDANPCTTDSCDAATGCKHVADNAAKCSDGDLCTNADKCTSGVCIGTDVACTAFDECHEVGTCNADTGVCDDPRSEDNKPCTGGHCQSGKCVIDPIGEGGAGGEAGAAAGGGGTGPTPEGGKAGTTGTGGGGNEPTTDGGEPTTSTGGNAGKGGKSSGGSSVSEGGAADIPDHVFVRDPGGCSCSVPARDGNGLAALAALAVGVGVVARRRRRQRDVLL